MEKLATYLRDNHLTQKAFAARVGVTPGALSQWLGGGSISLARVARIHELTGIPVQELVPRFFASKSADKPVRNRSQSKARRLREPANA